MEDAIEHDSNQLAEADEFEATTKHLTASATLSLLRCTRGGGTPDMAGGWMMMFVRRMAEVQGRRSRMAVYLLGARSWAVVFLYKKHCSCSNILV
ncbi:hypothetical protein C4D60_Mb06t34040 [Musa balbisiana]|uniref:Uncharacterized protein n=1 Tax=Musa balbisiana TaxID=52838 RepID=A0A4S8IV57_MUSBA|nr:hypothetical protein C4D60_Mb06t34040 [Musa balbisiana]